MCLQIMFNCTNVGQVRAQEFSLGGGGADLEGVYNVCGILKVTLLNSCRKCNCNISMFVTAFMCVQIAACSVTHII
jgi:hypothetical protein